jgi:hypothetical protein
MQKRLPKTCIRYAFIPYGAMTEYFQKLPSSNPEKIYDTPLGHKCVLYAANTFGSGMVARLAKRYWSGVFKLLLSPMYKTVCQY